MRQTKIIENDKFVYLECMDLDADMTALTRAIIGDNFNEEESSSLDDLSDTDDDDSEQAADL